MTLPNFPNNPTLGQQFTVGSTTYECTFNGSNPQWRVLSQADKGLRQELASHASTVLVAGIPAKAFRTISGIKDLLPIENVELGVVGFYSGTTLGGGSFVYKPDMSASLHNGGTVIAAAALGSWNGTQVGLNAFLNWSGAGVGCYVKLASDRIKVTDFGAVAGSVQIDCGAVANHIYTKLGAVDLNFPRGAWYIMTGIRLYRGCSISGDSVFDDMTASKLVKAPTLAQPVIATDKYYGGGATHYYAITGICIEGNRETRPNGVARKEAIAWWGVFVGSYIDNVFVLNNYGTGISLEHSYDTKIGLLWINNCDVGNGGLLEIDQQLNNPGGPTGLIEIDCLYTENAYRETADGDPRLNPSNRGHGIKAGMIYRLSINNLHQESVDVGVELTHGVCYSVNILNHSISWCGRPTGRMAAHYWNNVTPHLYNVGPVVLGDPLNNYAFFDCSTDVFNGGQIAKIPMNTERWGGMSFVSLAGQRAELYGTTFVGNETRRAIGNQATTYGKKQIVATNANRYHYERANGDYWQFGSSSNQAGNAEVDFFRIESYGNSGDRVTFLKPFVIPTLPVTDFTEALYVTPSGELRIRIGTGTFKVNLTAV
jgi:hypothetical protein